MMVRHKQKTLFGTNGVRGVVGTTITPELVMQIAMILGTMREGTIAVGRDSRISGAGLINAAKSGLLATGCNVVDCGILPTPALQYFVKHSCNAGMMITASHNPSEYNGVKVIDSDGTEMAEEDTAILEKNLFSLILPRKTWNQYGSEHPEGSVIDTYIEAIVSKFPKSIGSSMTVVVDPGSGAGVVSTPEILRRLGCRVITINGILDGTFPGRLPEPSPEGLSALADLVRHYKADLGIAHDGDADRTVFLDEKGEFIEENKELALFSRHACKKSKGIIVTTVSSSKAIEDVARKHASSVVSTPVGSIYVARKMLSLIQQKENVIFGGEGNGGLIFPEHQFCRDGGMAAATMIEILSQQNEPISALSASLPAYHMVKTKIQNSNPEKYIASLERKYRHERIEKTDGLKIIRHDAWALIRPSGTEPLIRIIIESKKKGVAERWNREIKEIFAE
jgi:phosphomannomutase / phosphoglucomutase